jgi:hypothetical protein
MKTSRAHGLGTLNVNKSDDVLPHIISPVFAGQGGIGAAYVGGQLVVSLDGKVAPHNLIWPAFWGSLKAEKVTPINIEIARTVAGKALAGTKPPRSGDWLSLTEKQIIEVLTLLSVEESIEGTAVYISGGKLYRLDDKGKLTAVEHAAAWPYRWPIAHNVRPAAQSLGVHGCQDCHSTDSPFFFGRVAVDSTLASEREEVKKMVEFQDVDPVYIKAFAVSFVFRPWLKVAALASCAVLAAVLLLYALKALACITKVLAGED